jgi:hypothetical protein
MKGPVRSFISGKEIVFLARCVLDAFEERHLRTQKVANFFSTRHFKTKQIMVKNHDTSSCYAAVICKKMSVLK